MTVKNVKLRDIDDDDSDYMKELTQKFMAKHGEELERIMGRKIQTK